MKQTVLFFSIALVFHGSAIAQSSEAKSWQKLIDTHKIQDAERLCTSWTTSTELTKKVEAEKCLANVALAKSPRAVVLQGNDIGGGSLGDAPVEVDEALLHLNRGIALAPEDLSIHKGRLHVLEISSRYDEMAKALDESLKILRGKTDADEWIAYSAELLEHRQVKAALQILEVLNRHFPNSHDVIGNMAASHMYLKDYDKALEFALRAAKLAPKDPIDNWNVAWIYDKSGQIESAKKWYPKAIALETDSTRKKEALCMYAEFLNLKTGDRTTACKLERENCPSNDQPACSTVDHRE